MFSSYILNFFGGATIFDSFLEAYKTSETKSFFPYERFDDPEKLKKTQLPPHETFLSKLRNNISLKKDYSDFQKSTDGASRPKKHYRNWIFSSHVQLEKKTIEIWPVCSNKKTCLPSKTLCGGITTRSCPYARINAEDGRFLPQKRKWPVKPWMYFAKPCKYLSSEVN